MLGTRINDEKVKTRAPLRALYVERGRTTPCRAERSTKISPLPEGHSMSEKVTDTDIMTDSDHRSQRRLT